MSHRLVLLFSVVPIASLCLFGQGAQLQITNATLPQGQQGSIYSEVFNATGGSTPYSWKISAGTTPPGVAMNGNGNLVGTPDRAGAFNFTVTITDGRSNTASSNFSLTVAPATGYDGPARLPITTVASSMADTPAPGTVISVDAGGDVQAALDSAHCGDTIELQAGATFTGTFRFPALGCDANHWIIVRTSAPDGTLPSEGHRLTPCYAGVTSLLGRPPFACKNSRAVLAQLVAKSIVGPVIFQTGANHYRLIGLELVRMAGTTTAISLVSVEPEGHADHIVLDRSWVHGTVEDETRVGFNLSGTKYVGVVDSYFSDFHCISITGGCLEAHAISGGTGDHQGGPYKIEDNFLEASGQAILFGGGPATTTPTDITIRFNHFFKPWQWMKGNSPFQGGPSGTPFIVRHALELKNAIRVLAENNLIENVWGGFGEAGTAILLTPKNQHLASGNNVCPTCEVTDVTIRYTRISHASGGFEIQTALSGNGIEGAPAKAGARFSIHDVVMEDISRKYLGWGRLFLVGNSWPSNPLNTITINHITGFPDPGDGVLALHNLISYPEMYGFVFTNNIVTAGKYPVWNTGGGVASCAYANVPLTSLMNCFTSFTFTNNAVIADPSHYPPSSWPEGNLYAGDIQDVGFQSSSSVGGNYQLQPTSPYKNRGTDGRDLGADIVGLNQALKGVE
jgi:Putative Ig domain